MALVLICSDKWTAEYRSLAMPSILYVVAGEAALHLYE